MMIKLVLTNQNNNEENENDTNKNEASLGIKVS